MDLAGSERVHVTGAVGKRLEESKKINASLSALGGELAVNVCAWDMEMCVPVCDRVSLCVCVCVCVCAHMWMSL